MQKWLNSETVPAELKDCEWASQPFQDQRKAPPLRHSTLTWSLKRNKVCLIWMFCGCSKWNANPPKCFLGSASRPSERHAIVRRQSTIVWTREKNREEKFKFLSWPTLKKRENDYRLNDKNVVKSKRIIYFSDLWRH